MPYAFMFSNPKLSPFMERKKKSSTAKVLNVDEYLYCKPKRFLPRCVALELDVMPIDTPWAHAFKTKAFPIHEETAEIINNKGA